MPLLRLLPLLCLLCTSALGGEIGTAAQREALFERLVEQIMHREAFSPIKYERLGWDVTAELEACRSDFTQASNEIELFYALVKLSAARRDRHLYVAPLGDGLDLRGSFETLAQRMGHPGDVRLEVPLRFRAGFADPASPTIYVARLAAHSYRTAPVIGDVVTHVNGTSIATFVEQVEPYWRYSTRENFWMRLATNLGELTPSIPPWMYQPKLRLGLRRANGTSYELSLPYKPQASIEWVERTGVYPGFTLAERYDSFDVYAPSGDRRVLLLRWHAFGRDLFLSIKRFMKLAEERNWLAYDLIIDCTRARGGSRGAYALQRFSPKPFKVTFGNVRISDVIPKFAKRIGDKRLSIKLDKDLDNGAWVKAWMKDVVGDHAAGRPYSADVPFKCAHAPKDSDGMLQPSAPHFCGRLVCWFGPEGGSHLDQFAAMVIDNQLGHSIGMSTGGYSNTWEVTEEITLPESSQTLARFMWTIGQTIRPNGEVLEGNPPKVAEWFPPTPENAATYEQQLLERSLRWLDR